MATSKLKILFLCTDAFGGRGGIAEFNRNLCRALCSWAGGCEVVLLPCRVEEDVEADEIPPGVDFHAEAAAGRFAYMRCLWRTIRLQDFDLIICGHLFLARGAAVAKAICGVPVLGILHGIDAWEPPQRRTIRWASACLDQVLVVSDFTRQRFLRWSGMPEKQATVLPNMIDLQRFTPGERPGFLVERHKLGGRTVLLTMARLDAQERYKGIDEVLEILPKLREPHPEIAYVVAGDGSDRERLEARAQALGLEQVVQFVGYIPEEEKQAYYRLADAFVMPGRGEGFGIVYLEAMASGIPVVASIADASREAVRDGLLGELADPADPASIQQAIEAALKRPRGGRPEGLEYFSTEEFNSRVHLFLDEWRASRKLN